MHKRKVKILAVDEMIAQFFKAELESIFGNLLEIRYVVTENKPLPFIHESDLFLYTDPSILIEFMPKIKSDSPVLMMKRTLSKEAVQQIEAIPKNSRCLVCNINSFMANETLATIYQLGLNHLQLIPYTAGAEEPSEPIDYVIAHMEYDFISHFDEPHVIIGSRIFDINTILDIVSLLDISEEKGEQILLKYSLRIPSMWKGLNDTLENKRILSSKFQLLLNELSTGVIVLNENNQIDMVNLMADSMFDSHIKQYERRSLQDLVQHYPTLQLFQSTQEIQNELLLFNGKKLIISIKNMHFDAQSYGRIILINTYKEVVDIHQKIHQKIIGKGQYSRYTFESFIGKDPRIIERIEICKRIANADASILINGESGTGKEIFAGSIHNYSERRNEPFVAINCAALPESLLESELFGYEEGAFTGAKKGGKIGFFESADRGTLFLDEIGELPLKLQARLLRVLQEKEIIRLGGDSVIKIDTRIIAATNQDLFTMAEAGNFRKDLFYRLNVFQIDAPPLRERRADIPKLIQGYPDFMHGKHQYSKLFLQFCMSYEWPGNVRELNNVIEYLIAVSDGTFIPRSLPSYLKKREFLDFPVRSKGLRSQDYYILDTIDYLKSQGNRTGRRNINEAFNRLYYHISEIEVRAILEKLKDRDWIEYGSGPIGCTLTPIGFEKLNSK
jgi:transcriptional regulator with PAS, ATPase and Fis domain